MKKKQQNRKKTKQTEKFVSTEIKQSAMANEDYQKVKAFVVVLVIVLALVGLLFLLNGKLVTKDLDKDKTTTATTEPAYDEGVILGDNIFNQSDKEYMVLLYDSNNKENGMLYSGLFNTYSGSSVVYAVDAANKMNAPHFNESIENENTKPTKASEVVVKGPTLLIIKNKEVAEYITDTNTIVEKLKAK